MYWRDGSIRIHLNPTGHQRQRGPRHDAPTVSAFASNAKSLDTLKHSVIDIEGSNVQLDKSTV